ncbi:hypothetical protein GEMRC1_001569 [Eukaryota sp. GEM-RC1]
METNINYAPIHSKQPIFDVQCHPSQPLLAVGVFGGIVRVFRYAAEPDTPQLVANLKPHKKSIRSLSFSADGTTLYTGSKDKAIKGISVGETKVAWKRIDAHSHCVCALQHLSHTSNSFSNPEFSTLLASGDENGTIKIWDTRTPKNVKCFNDGADFISSFLWHPQSYTLLAGSGDGSLYSYDFRSASTTFSTVSEDLGDEILSLSLLKNGSKLLAGTLGGDILIYDWNYFGDFSDKLVGHPDAVESIVKIDEDTVLTSSDDGIIRIVSVLPNQLLGVLGEHGQFPVERMSKSYDGQVLASTSHDNCVKLWDLSVFYEDGDEEVMDEEVKPEGEGFFDGL